MGDFQRLTYLLLTDVLVLDYSFFLDPLRTSRLYLTKFRWQSPAWTFYNYHAPLYLIYRPADIPRQIFTWITFECVSKFCICTHLSIDQKSMHIAAKRDLATISSLETPCHLCWTIKGLWDSELLCVYWGMPHLGQVTRQTALRFPQQTSSLKCKWPCLPR